MNLSNKNLIISFLALFFVGIIAITLYVYNDRQFIDYDPDNVVPSATADISAIGLIGDSWVAGQKLDSTLENSLASRGLLLDVISHGYPNYRSSQILQELNHGNALELLENPNISNIIVIAGVNDSAGHMGANYYAHHMAEIVNLISSHNKTPIIIELPEFGIEEPEPFKSSVKHNLYKLLFDANKTNILGEYRLALDKKLTSSSASYEIIETNKLLFDYHKQISIYNDPRHLNESGRELLSKHIANQIIKIENNNESKSQIKPTAR